MKTRIFTGHALAEETHARTRELIEELGRAPRCAVLLSPGNPAMHAYATRQREAAAALGAVLDIETYAEDPQAVLSRLRQLREDDAVDGVMTLYPLPAGLSAMEVAEAIGPQKDVDGLHPLSAGLLALGAEARFPATAQACKLAIQHLVPDLKGAEVVIIGASRVVGRPLAAMLLDKDATVTVCHAATRELADHTRRADIIVTAAGVPGLITDSHIRDGAILVDVSIVRVEAGLVGDVDAASVEGKASVLTHVPDGIGPITTACLLQNVVRAALERQHAN
jgi:methylenetetrahydrofolate dehydrogenase (NADP+)/methenyltetrahydrofolate cyclohydrolase